MLSMYLCGAIRDSAPDDVAWREELIDALEPYIDMGVLGILNPLGGKQRVNGVWQIQGQLSDGRHIVSQDYWCVDRSDIIVANLSALAQGYPNIGSLMELGRSTNHSQLRYIIIPKSYKGHDNGDMYRLHPFIARSATTIFESTDECITFLQQHVPVLAGINPKFNGVVIDAVYKVEPEAAAEPAIVCPSN